MGPVSKQGGEAIVVSLSHHYFTRYELVNTTLVLVWSFSSARSVGCSLGIASKIGQILSSPARS